MIDLHKEDQCIRSEIEITNEEALINPTNIEKTVVEEENHIDPIRTNVEVRVIHVIRVTRVTHVTCEIQDEVGMIHVDTAKIMEDLCIATNVVTVEVEVEVVVVIIQDTRVAIVVITSIVEVINIQMLLATVVRIRIRILRMMVIGQIVVLRGTTMVVVVIVVIEVQHIKDDKK